MKKITTIAASAAIAASFAAANANASENPFSMQMLNTGDNVAMSTSEGMCGGDKKAKDGKCGEGKCGGDKAKAKDKAKSKAKDGKCGEGKCGGA
ncbi:MAG TPA: hypothetical protein ENJ87_05410 [Gammaproteobacteria bacterium]|nr:hypothetical protein [Gammaproteobacteria bacterium]